MLKYSASSMLYFLAKLSWTCSMRSPMQSEVVVPIAKKCLLSILGGGEMIGVGGSL
jgi:hypothetical protein